MNKMIFISGFAFLLIGSAIFLGSEIHQQQDLQDKLENQRQKNSTDENMIKTFENYQSNSKQFYPTFNRTEDHAKQVISLGFDYADSRAKGDSKELNNIDSKFKKIATPDVVMTVKRQFTVPDDVSSDWKIPVKGISIQTGLSFWPEPNIFGTFNEFGKTMYFQADYDLNKKKITYIEFSDW